MRGRSRGFLHIRSEDIRVMSQTADLHPVRVGETEHRRGVRLLELADVNVRTPRIPPISLARRPTHQLHTRIAGRLAQREYFFQRKVGDDGAHETKLHSLRFYCARPMLLNATYTMQAFPHTPSAPFPLC